MAIYDLLSDVTKYPNLPAEYIEKQIHEIPKTQVVDRVVYLQEQAKNKVIFDFGATGHMSFLLQKAAKEYYGTDIQPNQTPSPGIKEFYQINLDHTDTLPDIPGLELVIAGETIEHLSNAGHFLDLVRHYYKVPFILTTPNAFSAAGINWMKRGVENVNRDHVAWYSYHTLKVLIERHGFKLIEWYWYNGKPLVAEGIIFKLEPDHGAN